MIQPFPAMQLHRKPFRIKIALFATALFTLPFGSNIIAQDNSKGYENWYQVELIIFKRAGQRAETESWPKNLTLAYPTELQYLIDPALQEEPENTEIPGEAENGLKPTPEEEPKPLVAAYTLLDSRKFGIGSASYALKKERGVSVLFHESWLQPMTALDDAPAIVIKGGEKFGDHHELEGTITFSVSRYLHAHTNLWLTNFIANYGQESEHWPDLPTPPSSALHTLDTTADTSALTESTTANNFGFSLENQSSFSMNETADAPSMLNDFSALTSKPFLIQRIITLTQNRRMRSTELHYIDHPQLGLLVKITPFTNPEFDLQTLEKEGN
ncbi:CsiV family protein [Teredinibacter haidensis]|uniref:CsiV family protein n=1 Tax=Teredinibacter haidensis TaxID=2731755 RepID=UPI0009F8A5A7|nr:CsiV family protein [Teredinibacter haidensis]